MQEAKYPGYPRLEADFFRREEVVTIARQLLGMYLLTRFQGQICVGKIVETEAYRGRDDKACHAHLMRRTKRTKTMFLPGGTAYIYLCYGIHHLFNVVTGPEGVPDAVLIRAVEPVYNLDAMLHRRGMEQVKPQLTAGPGVMTKAMGITTDYDGQDLLDERSPIRLEDPGDEIPERKVASGPRIGIDYAEECAAWPWRFYLPDNKWVSRKGR
ncbi:MAG: DNA-3-methyladenine glycosylase [Saprospiraceae bacterium]|nr:DNA-3-methyladenine glycosylase [Saprospiraceae bacterium]